MTVPEPEHPGGRCPLCGGRWIEGRLAVPIVGSLRFAYRLGTNEVATEVTARMCGSCGHVGLRGRDPELISRAERAAAQAPPGPWWARRASSAGGAATRRGQGQERGRST